MGHTLDVSGMYSDRLGLFGKGWLELLEGLGLSTPEALDAMVDVANVLQGNGGAPAIWRAFTAALDTTDHECESVGEVRKRASHAAAYTAWSEAVRKRLRVEGVDDDGPYRMLASMGATGMDSGDTANFSCLVQDWLEAVDGDFGAEQDVRTWAADISEAI